VSHCYGSEISGRSRGPERPGDREGNGPSCRRCRKRIGRRSREQCGYSWYRFLCKVGTCQLLFQTSIPPALRFKLQTRDSGFTQGILYPPPKPPSIPRPGSHHPAPPLAKAADHSKLRVRNIPHQPSPPFLFPHLQKRRSNPIIRNISRPLYLKNNLQPLQWRHDSS
jgi:hypothetical protein